MDSFLFFYKEIKIYFNYYKIDFFTKSSKDSHLKLFWKVYILFKFTKNHRSSPLNNCLKIRGGFRNFDLLGQDFYNKYLYKFLIMQK